MTYPSRCSVISSPARWRTMRADSDRMISTSRGSFSVSAAIASARSDGWTLSRSTKRSSALETILWAMTTISPAEGRSPPRSSASAIIAARSSPGPTSGTSGTPISSMRVGDVIRADRSARAGCLARRKFSGKPFHLQRVLDRGLLFGRERQRRPVAGVLGRARGVGVERHLHFDHAVDAIAAARGLQSGSDVGQQRVAIELRCLAAGADEALGGPPGIFRHHGAGRRDIDGHRGFRTIVDRRVPGAIIFAFERDALFPPKPPDQSQGFAEAGKALLELRPLDPGRRDLVERLSRSRPENDAAREHAAERPERLRDDAGVIAERRREHARAHHYPRGLGAEHAEPGQRKRRVRPGMLPGLEMIADEHGIVAEAFGEDRELQELIRPELLGGRLVAQSDQEEESS